MEKAVCPAATACAEAGACQSELTAEQLLGLALTVVAPVGWVILSLALLSTSSRTASRPDMPRSHPHVSSVASTDMLVVLVCLTLGYAPTFFSLATSDYPCATPIGGCGSICA